MQVALEKIIVKPGQQLLLQDISWKDLEEILEEFGEQRSSRISYSNGVLEIMVPLPEHEKDKEIIGEIIRILLDKLEIDFEPLGSTLNNYLLLRVPELWRYTKKGFQINLLKGDRYIESKTSPNFPDIPIVELVERHIKQAQIEGRSKAIRAFKKWVKKNV